MEPEVIVSTRRPHVTELLSGMRGFGWIDYCILVGMLTISAAIGIYFGYKDKQKNRNIDRRRDSAEIDYLVGGRKLSIFPVAMSLTASWISAASILGTTSEVYVYGTQFAFFLISIVVGSIPAHYIFIPVFHDLKITSSFEYLEARFDRKLRVVWAAVFVVRMIIETPVVLYATALAFNQLTGVNIYIIPPITCTICIFYTCLGGMKAVVWTDVIQTVIMFGTIITIVVKGTVELGLETIWERNWESGRLELPEMMTMDPTIRHSMFSVLIGGMFLWLPGISVRQMFMQRFNSLPTVTAARKSLWIFVFAMVLLLGMCYYCGLMAYAKYHNCDPMITKLAKSKDQILPVLVTVLFKNIPGFSGLFITGIFSATLSTLSTVLNSLAAVVLEDCFKKIVKKPLSLRMSSFIMRGTVVITGVICVSLVFVVKNFGNLLQLSYSIVAITSGSAFAIYVMGLLMPRINTKSATVGGTVGLLIMVYIVIRGQLDQLNGKLKFSTKPVAANDCPYEFDSLYNGFSNATVPASDSRELHHISYLLYNLFGFTITLLTSTAVSIFVKRDESEIRPNLLAPFIRKAYGYKIPANQDVEVVHHFDNINK